MSGEYRALAASLGLDISEYVSGVAKASDVTLQFGALVDQVGARVEAAWGTAGAGAAAGAAATVEAAGRAAAATEAPAAAAEAMAGSTGEAWGALGESAVSAAATVEGATAKIEASTAGLDTGVAAAVAGGGAGFRALGADAAAGAGEVDAASKGLLASMAPLAAIAGIGLGIKGAFDQAQAATKVMAATRSELVATHDASGQTADGIHRLATELGKLDALNPTQVQQGLNTLLQAPSLRGDVFTRAAKDLPDLAAAMGSSLPAAAKQWAKALEDPAIGMGRLSRANVALSKSEQQQIKDMEASGNLVGAQGQLMADLEGRTKSLAESQVTAAGRARKAVQDWERTLGQDFASTSNVALVGIEKLATGFDRLPAPVQTASVAFVAAEVISAKFGSSISALGQRIASFSPGATFRSWGTSAKAAEAAQQDLNAATARTATASQAYNASIVATNRAKEQQVAVTESATSTSLDEENALFQVTLAEQEQTAATVELNAALDELDAAQTRVAVTSEAVAANQGVVATAIDTAGGALSGIGGLLAAATIGWKDYNDAASSHSTSESPGDIAKRLGSINVDDTSTKGIVASTNATDDLTRALTDLASHKSVLNDLRNGGNIFSIKGANKGDLQTIHQYDEALTQLFGEGAKGRALAEFFSTGLGVPDDLLRKMLPDITAAKAAWDSYANSSKGAAEIAYKAWEKTRAGQLGLAQSTSTLQDAVEAFKQNEATAAGGGDVWGEKLAALSQYQSDTKAVASAQATVTSDLREQASAQRSVADAAYSYQQAVRGIAEARYAEGQAARQVNDALATEAADTRNLTNLANDLTQARKDAAEALWGDKDSVAQGALRLRQDKLTLSNAQQAAAAPMDPMQFGQPGSANQAAANQLAVDQAKLQLAEDTHAQALATQNLTAAQKAGIDGSSQVVAAQQALAAGYKQVANDALSVQDAQHGYANSVVAVADAQHSAASAAQGYQDALTAQSQAAQKLKTDTDAVRDAENTRAQDLAIAVVNETASELTAAKQSSKLKEQLLADWQAEIQALDAVGIHGAAAFSFLQTAIGLANDPALQRLLGTVDPYTPSSYGTGGGGGSTGSPLQHRARGGPLHPGQVSEVDEGGETEVWRSGGRTYLIPGSAGMVTPLMSAASTSSAGAHVQLLHDMAATSGTAGDMLGALNRMDASLSRIDGLMRLAASNPHAAPGSAAAAAAGTVHALDGIAALTKNNAAVAEYWHGLDELAKLRKDHPGEVTPAVLAAARGEHMTVLPGYTPSTMHMAPQAPAAPVTANVASGGHVMVHPDSITAIVQGVAAAIASMPPGGTFYLPRDNAQAIAREVTRLQNKNRALPGRPA